MSLHLSPADMLEYSREYMALAALRDRAVASHDAAAAKKYRQEISALYTKYREKQLPAEPEEESELSVWELRELAVTSTSPITSMEERLKQQRRLFLTLINKVYGEPE